ncbi:hypothetical protein RB653_007605 [Dictyostelium firmibasis]|uniref:Uncharacterized protein n=1 Tax=Dictyostelium firmibasis TaxID=79012 RepID=A0AAN7TUU7_9MYCE
MNNFMTTTTTINLNNLNSNSFKVILNNNNSYYSNNNNNNNNNNNYNINNNNSILNSFNKINNNMIPSDQMKRKYPYLSQYFPSTYDALVKKVCSWVIDQKQKNTCRGASTPSCEILSNNNMETGVSDILETILTYIIDDLKENEYLLLVSLYFADKYVKKAGVRQSQILWLILISCILSFKMYSDSNKIQTKKIEKRLSIDIKDNLIGKMEFQFLSNIGYNLYIDEKTITSFITCLFIDYKINCQTNLDLIQSILFQIQSVIKTSD